MRTWRDRLIRAAIDWDTLTSHERVEVMEWGRERIQEIYDAQARLLAARRTARDMLEALT